VIFLNNECLRNLLQNLGTDAGGIFDSILGLVFVFHILLQFFYESGVHSADYLHNNFNEIQKTLLFGIKIIILELR
jgi:hypothetical protein